MSANPHERMVEALLFAADEPLDEHTLATHLPADVRIGDILQALQEHYATRGVQLVQVAGGWMLRTAEDLRFVLQRQVQVKRTPSKAAMETLAIIAYHQPITRPEIEEIRGVRLSAAILDALMETGWVQVRGRRQSPGKPSTYGTTDTFLSHFGFHSLDDLPDMEELHPNE